MRPSPRSCARTTSTSSGSATGLGWTGPIARGELPADTDVPAAVDLPVGPIYHRVLMTGDPVDEAFVDTLVEHSVSGYGAR